MNDIRGNQNLAHKAHWEAKTGKLIEKNIVRNRVEDMRRRQAANLEQRKARLAELLAAEDRIYEQEFNDNLQTPEQVREQMFQRLQTPSQSVSRSELMKSRDVRT